jgi:hypothetical protein
MPNTDIRFGATPIDTRDDIRTARMAIEAQTVHGDVEAVQAWTERLNRLMDEAHEQAHREDERRWAVEQTEALGMGTYGEDAEAVQDLLVQVRRNWRLSREDANRASYVNFSRYATLSGNAATELEEEFGVEVEGS